MDVLLVWFNIILSAGIGRQVDRRDTKAMGDSNVRWRWADSVRAVERAAANIALAAPILAKHAAVLNEHHRQHWATWYVKGLEAEVSERTDEAIHYYLKAIARGPAIPSVTDRAIALLIKNDALDDASSTLAQARTQRFPFINDQMLSAEIDFARSQRETALAQGGPYYHRFQPERALCFRLDCQNVGQAGRNAGGKVTA